MTDYNELKRLAEDASEFHSSGVEPGTYNPYQNDFFAAATPQAVLALIAENKSMAEFKEHMVQLRETHGFESWAAALVEIDRLKAENDGLRGQHDRDSGELRKLCAARDSARRQRDKLTVDNDALRAAASQSIKFVAFAFDQGIEGAEQAGLAIENALLGTVHG